MMKYYQKSHFQHQQCKLIQAQGRGGVLFACHCCCCCLAGWVQYHSGEEGMQWRKPFVLGVKSFVAACDV